MTAVSGLAGATPQVAEARGPRYRRWAGHAVRWAAVPYVLAVVVAVLVAAGFALGVRVANLHNGLIAVSFTAVGVFVLRQRRGHREGWLFVATGAAHAVMFFGRQYGFHGGDLPARSWVTWLGVWPLALVLVLAGVTLMAFPDGRLPSRRWRVVVVAMVVAGAAVAALSALWPVEYDDNELAVAHPLDLPGAAGAQQVWDVAGRTAYLLFQVAWVTCVVVRLRRAEGDEARQLRWFAYAVSLGAAAMVLSVLTLGSPVLGLLAVPVVPVVAGVAIVTYRLYDIDVVINKTLVVGAMAAVITAGYVAVVAGVGRLVGVPTGPNPVLPLVATAVLAVAFEPVHRRVQRGADRLVYGNRPTPYEALARLPSRLGEGERGDPFVELASAVADGVGAAEVTLWVGPADEMVAVASWPPRSGDDMLAGVPRAFSALGDGDGTYARAITHRGVLRGAVTLTKAPGEALGTAEARLLGDLAAQAGLVIDNVGLGAELQERLQQIAAQAAELRAAAKRIVAAQDEARRRLERDLHDGAQQRLVTLALSLQAVAVRAAGTDAELAARVDEARHELSQAIAELREMARGIHPAILTQEGLEAALSFLAERSPIPVHLEVQLGGRLAQDVEATAYFVASEALTNAAKHSGASRVEVAGRFDGGSDGGTLAIAVADDGRGGADGRWGTGLQGLADRLAALDGRLTVRSPAGGGTRLDAEIPCG
jgi:signal transduction histidine kinase